MPLGKSIGSGTIIDSDGTILTCAHVVVDFQSMRAVSRGKVDVTLQDGRTFVGTVVNGDFHSDIAVVKIKSKTPLPSAKLGSSCKLRPGDWVIAMGVVHFPYKILLQMVLSVVLTGKVVIWVLEEFEESIYKLTVQLMRETLAVPLSTLMEKLLELIL